MDYDTVHRAYRLQSLFDQKHPSSRNIDASTKELITLVLQSAAFPPPSQDIPYTPDSKEIKEELKLFAQGIHKQACKPGFELDTITPQITSAITKAIDTCFEFKSADPASQTTVKVLDQHIKTLEQQIETLERDLRLEKGQVALVLRLKSAKPLPSADTATVAELQAKIEDLENQLDRANRKYKLLQQTQWGVLSSKSSA